MRIASRALAESGRASHAAARTSSTRPELGWLALAGLEGWAAMYLLASALLPESSRTGLLVANRLDGSASTLLAACPLVGIALGVAGFWARARVSRARALRLVRLASPLCALWPARALLDRHAFGDRDLAFMATLAVMAVALERTLFWSWPDWLALHRRLARGRSAAAHGRRSRAIAWHVSIGVLVVCLAAFALDRGLLLHRKMLTSTFDLGLFENLLHNTLLGRHGIAASLRYFAQHVPLLAYALAPLYALLPRAETLLVVQAILVAGTALPLYLLARSRLGDGWKPAVLVAVYSTHPAIHGPLFFDFHFLTISGFFLMWAAFFAIRGRDVGFWAFLVLAMSCREDVALGVCIVAALGFLAGWPRRRLVASVMVVGGCWFAVLELLVMPRFGDHSFSGHYVGLISPGHEGMIGVLHTVLLNPLHAFGSLLGADKLLLALHLLVPLSFVPLRRVRLLPLLAPGLLVVGLATSPSALLRIHFHYVAHFVPYLFVGACLALATLSERARASCLLTMLVVCSIETHRFGAFFVETFDTSFHTVSFVWDEADERHLRDFAELAAQVPAAASLCAGEHEGPQLAARPHLASVKLGLHGCSFVLVSTRSLRWGGRQHLLPALLAGEYGLVDLRGDFLLARKGAPVARNPQGVAWLAAR